MDLLDCVLLIGFLLFACVLIWFICFCFSKIFSYQDTDEYEIEYDDFDYYKYWKSEDEDEYK